MKMTVWGWSSCAGRRETLDDRMYVTLCFFELKIYDPAAGREWVRERVVSFTSSLDTMNTVSLFLPLSVPLNRNKSCWSFILHTNEKKEKIRFSFDRVKISRKSSILIAKKKYTANPKGEWEWGKLMPLSAESWSVCRAHFARWWMLCSVDSRIQAWDNRWLKRSSVKITSDWEMESKHRNFSSFAKFSLAITPWHSTRVSPTLSTDFLYAQIIIFF